MSAPHDRNTSSTLSVQPFRDADAGCVRNPPRRKTLENPKNRKGPKGTARYGRPARARANVYNELSLSVPFGPAYATLQNSPLHTIRRVTGCFVISFLRASSAALKVL